MKKGLLKMKRWFNEKIDNKVIRRQMNKINEIRLK